jgi:hypothetical protein
MIEKHKIQNILDSDSAFWIFDFEIVCLRVCFGFLFGFRILSRVRSRPFDFAQDMLGAINFVLSDILLAKQSRRRFKDAQG